MADSTSIRAFVAISVDSNLRAVIQRLQEQLQRLVGSGAVRLVRPDQLHLTLKFFGNLPSGDSTSLIAALSSSCPGMPAFQLSISDLGCFPTFQKPNVIWLGLIGDLPALQSLQNKISEQTKGFGSHSEDRDFRPHLTIGRVKARPNEARQLGQAIQNQHVGELGRWEVRDVELIQSTLSPQGSSYRLLAAFPLDQQ